MQIIVKTKTTRTSRFGVYFSLFIDSEDLTFIRNKTNKEVSTVTSDNTYKKYGLDITDIRVRSC